MIFMECFRNAFGLSQRFSSAHFFSFSINALPAKAVRLSEHLKVMQEQGSVSEDNAAILSACKSCAGECLTCRRTAGLVKLGLILTEDLKALLPDILEAVAQAGGSQVLSACGRCP